MAEIGPDLRRGVTLGDAHDADVRQI